MRTIKSFILNLRDISDKYIRDNFRKIENKLNDIEDQLGNTSGSSSSGTSVTVSNSSSGGVDPNSDNVLLKTPQSSISALKLVRANGPDTILVSNPGGSYFESVVLGVITKTGLTGVLTPVLVYGELRDPFLDFPLNDTLYLGVDGSITNVAPNTSNLTIVGYSLGSGAIFINIQEPIILE
jgi:hypothetical protein